MKSIASKPLALIAMIALGVGATAKPAKAGPECDPIVNSAKQLVGLLTNLKEDFRQHYYHTPKFRKLMQDAGDMRKHANHILEIAVYRNTSIQHLEADVAEIDRLGHKLHNLVDRNEQRRRGHVHGNTKHTHQMLASMTNVIHTMQGQIQTLKQPVRRYGHRGQYSHNTGYRSQTYRQPRQPVYNAPAANHAPARVRPVQPRYSANSSCAVDPGQHAIAAFENINQWIRRR